MEKRRYNKGFHISFNKNRLDKNSDEKESKRNTETAIMKQSSERKKTNKSANIAVIDDSAEQFEERLVEDTISLVSKTESSSPIAIEAVKKNAKEVSTNAMTAVKPKVVASRSTEKSGISGLWYFAVLGLIPVIFAAKRQSQQIETWASTNVSKAKIAITGLYALGFASSFLLGNMWRPIMEEWMLIIPLTIAGSILVANALKSTSKSNPTRKRMSFAAVNASSFFGSLAIGAQTKLEVFQLVNPEAQTGLDSLSATLATIFLIVIMCFALAGVAALACNLACSGYGVLALFVMAGGSFLVMFLGVWAILTVIRGRERNRENLKTSLIVGSILLLIMFLPAGLAAVL